jgi:rhomboid protease GluP
MSRLAHFSLLAGPHPRSPSLAHSRSLEPQALPAAVYDPKVFQRKTSGSVVCPSCGSLVGVRDDKCYTCGRANPGLWGFGPLLRQVGADFGFVPLVMGASSTLYVLTLLASGANIRMEGLFSMLSPSVPVLFLFGASGSVPVFGYNRWWTVLSAGWLHGGLLHILFNMMMVRQIGPATADILGPARTVIVYTAGGIAGFLLSSAAGALLPPVPLLSGAQFTIGASAPIFGLLGALFHYGRTSSSMIRSWVTSYVVSMIFFGLVVPGVDNFAHAGGFLGGYAASAFMNPLTRERGDHLIIALGCLAATFLAIVFSIVSGFRMI